MSVPHPARTSGPTSSSESKRPGRRMFVGITGWLVPLCSRARIRTMDLGRASGSLTFGLILMRVERLACVYVTLNHVGGAEDHCAPRFRSRYSGGKAHRQPGA